MFDVSDFQVWFHPPVKSGRRGLEFLYHFFSTPPAFLGRSLLQLHEVFPPRAVGQAMVNRVVLVAVEVHHVSLLALKPSLTDRILDPFTEARPAVGAVHLPELGDGHPLLAERLIHVEVDPALLPVLAAVVGCEVLDPVVVQVEATTEVDFIIVPGLSDHSLDGSDVLADLLGYLPHRTPALTWVVGFEEVSPLALLLPVVVHPVTLVVSVPHEAVSALDLALMPEDDAVQHRLALVKFFGQFGDGLPTRTRMLWYYFGWCCHQPYPVADLEVWVFFEHQTVFGRSMFLMK